MIWRALPVSGIPQAEAASQDAQDETHLLHWDQPVLTTHQIPLGSTDTREICQLLSVQVSTTTHRTGSCRSVHQHTSGVVCFINVPTSPAQCLPKLTVQYRLCDTLHHPSFFPNIFRLNSPHPPSPKIPQRLLTIQHFTNKFSEP